MVSEQMNEKGDRIKDRCQYHDDDAINDPTGECAQCIPDWTERRYHKLKRAKGKNRFDGDNNNDQAHSEERQREQPGTCRVSLRAI